MKHQSHLLVDESVLDPSSEWTLSFSGWCFLRIVDGQGYWLGEAYVREANAGDLLVLPPMRDGVFRASQLGAVRLLYFRFCPELLSGFLTLSERFHLESAAAKIPPVVRHFGAGHPAALQFAALGNHASPNTLLRRCQILQVVGTVFARELAQPRVPVSAAFSPRKRLRVLMSQLTESEILEWTPTGLAARCGCSLRHFSRLFHNYFGVSVRAKQTELRLQKARQMLAETNSRISDIARSCGYRHLGLFNTLFKKHFGATPTQWRGQARQNTKLETCPAALQFPSLNAGTGP